MDNGIGSRTLKYGIIGKLNWKQWKMGHFNKTIGEWYWKHVLGNQHWKIELETLENSIENRGKWNWKHQPDSYHARTGHALPLKNSRVYKQLEKTQNPIRTK